MPTSLPSRTSDLIHSSTACPRCDGGPILVVAADPDSAFKWRECTGCGYLWAIPRGWMPHPEPPQVAHVGEENT
jgi:hypothetical protein